MTGLTTGEIGYRAADAGLTVLELSPVQASLEEAFMSLTHDAVEYRAPTSSEAAASSPGHTTPERIAA